MKIKFLILTLLLIATGCRNQRFVDKSRTKQSTTENTVKRDTIFIEKIVEKKVLVRDTVIKKVHDFALQGKPTYDSIQKKWLPFVFDYQVYNGTDSTRYKGSFSGETVLSTKINYEQKYKTLLEQYNSLKKQYETKEEAVVKSTEFQEAKKRVEAQGYSLEILAYCLTAVGVFSYLFGLFSPKIWAAIKLYFRTKFPIL